MSCKDCQKPKNIIKRIVWDVKLLRLIWRVRIKNNEKEK